MSKVIIGIAGKKGSGKDLLGKYLRMEGFKRLAFGDIIRDRVQRDFDLTDEQVNGALKEKVDTRWNATPRKIMEAYGMFFRMFDEDYWIKQLGKAIKEDPSDRIIITDVRLQREAEFLSSLGAKVIRLERGEDLRRQVYPDANSQSITEIDLDDYDGFDLVVPAERNKVPADLEKVAHGLLKDL